jgi:uncharacterized protein
MPEYLSPGVYVEETPSEVKPIAGVSTSTVGFIGIVKDKPDSPFYNVTKEVIDIGDGKKMQFKLSRYPVKETDSDFEIRIDGAPVTPGHGSPADKAKPEYDKSKNVAAPDTEQNGNMVRLVNDEEKKVANVIFTMPPANGKVITGDYVVDFEPVPAGEVRLCTTFSEYKKFFGDFPSYQKHRNLTHAVFGFFNNGGSRCYVARVTPEARSAATVQRGASSEEGLPGQGAQAAPLAAPLSLLQAVNEILKKFEAIDEIAIVAAPGITKEDVGVWGAIDTHCRLRTQDRFAIFDSPEEVNNGGDLDLQKFDPANTGNVLPDDSDFAAFYFPWIQVFDPATKAEKNESDGLVYVPPSGHIAGIYARVDTQRGVHKAPANEPVLGALGLKYRVSKEQQGDLNNKGVNCIRNLNGNILVWGARTIGGNRNQELKYINVRRTMLFLRESIDEGLQWVVFEPNTPALWQKIVRNVSAFLTNVWRSGALFGTTPQEAFYVKCDADLNTSDERGLGKVITEIGVSIVRPAEFVIFRISQFTAPGQ